MVREGMREMVVQYGHLIFLSGPILEACNSLADP